MLTTPGSSGATTVALTSFPRSPLAEIADIVLVHAMQATTFRTDALSGRSDERNLAFQPSGHSVPPPAR